MRRQTKIIATLGPSVASEEGVGSLVEAGMDVARLNFSHGDHDLHRKMFEWVRSESKRQDRTVAIMQDIQGPKLRVGKFPGGEIELDQDQEVELVTATEEGSRGRIPVSYTHLTLPTIYSV